MSTTLAKLSRGLGSPRKNEASVCFMHLRLQVRCLVGGMSGVTFRGLGACRVHVFLRLADAPARDLRAVPAAPAAAATLDSAEASVIL